MDRVKVFGIGSAIIMICALMVNELSAKEISTISGKMVKEKREVIDFESITVLGFGNLYIKQGAKESLIIQGESEDLSKIKSEVINNHLFLGPKDSSHNTDKAITYYLTIKSTSPLNLMMEGSSKANIKVKVDKLNIKIAGSGEVKAIGTAFEQTINLEGSGEFKGKKLLTNKASITITGVGTAEVNVSQDLDVKIYGIGIGKVKYYGKPKITQEISGEGEIIPL